MELTPYDELHSIYSDCFKSEHGFRPRFKVSEAEMRDYLESYNSRIDELRAQWAEEAEWLDYMEMLYEEEYRYEAFMFGNTDANDFIEDALIAKATRRQYVLPAHRRF